ncbi:MAG: methyltransferase domain-containing protein [Mycobacterium sp.]
MTDAVGRHPQYDVFADEFSDKARDNFYNAHYDRPACLRLLGDVSGRTVLDAACGPGWYAKELTNRGAGVIGFDQSPRMVWSRRARNSARRDPDRAVARATSHRIGRRDRPDETRPAEQQPDRFPGDPRYP